MTTRRAPLIPSGCPSAIAPPFTLTCSMSRPSSRTQATDWLANASLSSTRSRSSTVSPARSSALRVAGTGPMPMTDGSTPATAVLTIARERSQPERARPLRLDEHDRGGAVVDARGVAGGDRPARPERGLEPREALGGRVGARALVALDDAAARRRAAATGTGTTWSANRPSSIAADGALLAQQRERVLVRADTPQRSATISAVSPSETVTPCSARRGLTNRQPSVRVDELARAALVAGLRLQHDERCARHRLDAARHDDIRVAGHDRVRGAVDRLEARAAEAVHGLARDLDRQPREQHRHPRDVPVLLARAVRVAEDDVVDERRVDPGALDARARRRARRGRPDGPMRARRRGGRSACAPRTRSRPRGAGAARSRLIGRRA